MKHKFSITLILTMIFLLAQVIGLSVLYKYTDVDGTYKDLPLGFERPPVEQQTSYVYIALAIAIGTILLLLLIKYKLVMIWKIWFMLAVFFGLLFSFAAFINAWIAVFAAAVLSLWKVFKPSLIIHNFTELFIYGGLSAILVPILNLWSVSMVLIIISIYDMYAVWKSKHMIKLAKFQAKSRMFAGLFIPYGNKKIAKKNTLRRSFKAGKKKAATVVGAVLGGGDIAFPLLFAGVLMRTSFLSAVISSVCATAALFCLLFFGKSDKFYPAMPFISAGCFLGLLISRIILVWV